MKRTRTFQVTVTYDDEADLEGQDYKPRNERRTEFYPEDAVAAEEIREFIIGCPDGWGWFSDVNVTETTPS